MRWLTPLHIQIISNKKRNVQRQYYYHIAIIFYISKPPMRRSTRLCTPSLYFVCMLYVNKYLELFVKTDKCLSHYKRFHTLALRNSKSSPCKSVPTKYHCPAGFISKRVSTHSPAIFTLTLWPQWKPSTSHKSVTNNPYLPFSRLNPSLPSTLNPSNPSSYLSINNYNIIYVC